MNIFNAYVYHNDSNGKRIDYILPCKVMDAPRNRSVTGYGKKIPTHYMVQVNNKWRRVYCMVYSNSGTLYYMDKYDGMVIVSHVDNH